MDAILSHTLKHAPITQAEASEVWMHMGAWLLA